MLPILYIILCLFWCIRIYRNKPGKYQWKLERDLVERLCWKNVC